jgi:hypothetical protein
LTTFAETYACTSRVHCATCRVDAGWRKNVGAPDVCPHDVTADNLPSAPVAAPPSSTPREPRTDAGRDRLAICATCDAFEGACVERFPQVKDCKSKVRYLTGWLVWLDEPDSACPKRRW